MTGQQATPRQSMGAPIEAQGRAIFITREDDDPAAHGRLDQLDPTDRLRHMAGDSLLIWPLAPLTLIREGKAGPERTEQAEELMAQLIEIAAMEPPLRLIVLDPLQALVAGDVNRAEVAQALCSYMGELAAETRATVIVAHHMSKTREDGSQGSRLAVRGSATLVDGVRAVVALTPMEEAKARRLCERVGVEFEHNAAYRLQLVKSNAKADRQPVDMLRAQSGLLEAINLREAAQSSQPLTYLLERAIAEALDADKPFTLSGQAGLYAQRERLPEQFHTMGEKRLRSLARDLLNAGRLRQEVLPEHGKSWKWLTLGEPEHTPGQEVD
ncbi:AAA family ATPase [Magnetofaba australis]|nr:AAA family ATPase [Magnetofaba australis]